MFTGFSKEAASPFKLMLVVTLVQMSLTLQLMIGTGEFRLYPAAPFVILFTASWVLYFFSRRILKRVSFEIETVGLLLSSIGILLLSGEGLDTVKMQIAAFGIGIVLFCFLVWFMSDLERVMKLRLYIAIGAILLFVANLVLGKDVNGSRNWIFIGPFSFQPSEFIKIAFVFVGASTLDHLQTKKNITEFIVFAAICLAFLFLMRDFGTALIFFACFLIIAFMRSGSFRTIFLILAAACFGVFLILQFKPYVAQRFSGWMHVWEHTQDSLGYQQVRTMTYIASGGLFGLGLGNGILKYGRRRRQRPRVRYAVRGAGPFNGHGGAVRARPLYPLPPAAMSRAAAPRSTPSRRAPVSGMLLFQAALNVFGPTDVLPLTGVTLPFISAGGSSMISVWGLLAFLKASDERTYAARRAGRHPKGEADEDTISFTPPRYSPNDPPTPRPRVNTRAENTAPRSRGAYRVHISEENLSPGQSRTRRKDGDRR